ncbi:MAG TPA: aminotransferase class I/II-fold pyridoxal phosphate-dependent enzyme, partial [Candidatus Bathyarchaeia archaeon]|nr:aminotransferase class I/II-fold pyridoxal phosphate-dependent enzyme [Candidatus Bathyarchaeia archaeon]
QSTDALVILDEAYAEFASRSHIGLANHFDNLAVFRTFSKAFGLAGLRLGYAVVTAKLARSCEDMQLAFSVNQLAVQAGIAALSDRSFLKKTVATVVEGREFLRPSSHSKRIRQKPTLFSLTPLRTRRVTYRNSC